MTAFFHHRSLVRALRHDGHLGQHALAERLDEPLLLDADVVQDRACRRRSSAISSSHVACCAGSAETITGPHTSSGRTCRAASSNCLGQLQVPHELRSEHVRPPLLVRDRQGGGLVVRPRQVRPARRPACRRRLPLGTRRSTRRSTSHGPVDRDQAVGPRADHAGGLVRDGRAEQRRRGLGQAPHPGPIHADETVVRHLLAAQQRADHLDAFQEPGVPVGLRRPPVARHVLVERPRPNRARPRTVRGTSRPAWRSPARSRPGGSAAPAR